MTAEKFNLLSSAQKPFIEFLRAQKRSISTILAYGKDTSQLVEFLAEKKISQITSVTPQHLEEFKNHLAEKKYTLKSISRKLNSLKTFFKFLKSQEAISFDPAAEVSHPQYEIKPPRIFSKMEYRALRDTCREDIRLATIVELMLQTGIRIGEISRLELGDIKNEEIYIKPYESQPGRTIPLNRAAKAALERYLTERAPAKTKIIFVTKTGRPFLARNIRAAIDRYFKIAGIENARVNDLRNTWLAYHLTSGTSPVFLSKIAGHRRLSTTERYLEFVKEKTTGKEKVKLEEL